jgi:hypothetical protein
VRHILELNIRPHMLTLLVTNTGTEIQEPTKDHEASIPTENVRDSPNLSRTVTVRQKAAKRTLPLDLAARELDILSPPPPQAEDIPARMKR